MLFMKVMKSVARQCQGQKDYKSVNEETGVRERKQKHLVLGNLRELYVKFLEDEAHPKIGFSTFCTLRPPHCVLAGSAGTHSVCMLRPPHCVLAGSAGTHSVCMLRPPHCVLAGSAGTHSVCMLRPPHCVLAGSAGTHSVCMLRPPHCVLAGRAGTHSVCVCTHHQNPKLMLTALNAKGITYHDLMKSGVSRQHE